MPNEQEEEKKQLFTPEEVKKIRSLMKEGAIEMDEMYLEEHPGLYAAMVVSKTELLGGMFPCIDVYLINASDTRYPSVKVLTGAFCSMGDDLMETGKRVTEPVALEALSALKIGASDIGELDFVVWFDIDITDKKTYYHEYRFSLPKPYSWDKYTSMKLPFLDVEGMMLPLSARRTGSIDDYVKGKGLASKYFENKDGEMIQREEKEENGPIDTEALGLGPYLSEEDLKTRRIALINCEDEEGCGFAVEFENPNCTFFYCKPDKWGVNVDLARISYKRVECRTHGKMERYDLLEEDNICPICENTTLAIISTGI